MTVLKRAVESWNQFWFAPIPLSRLGLMRLLLSGTFFVIYGIRQFRIDFFDERSLIPRELQLNVFPDFYRPFFSYNFWPDSWAFAVHLLLVALLLLMALGLSNRFLMILTWVLHMGFIHRNYSVLFGADVIGGIFLFYLAFTDCNATWNIRSLIKKEVFSPLKSRDGDLLTPMFFRLIQIQICIIYAFTGFEKLKGVTWWDGTALWTVFANPQMSLLNMLWVRHVPWLISIATFVTIIFEIYFPAAILMKKVRPWWLLAGVIFHAGIGVFLDLVPFSLVMISTYFTFVDLRKDFFKTS